MPHIEKLETRRFLSSVAALTLINADTGQSLGPLVQGQKLDLAKLPTRHLSVQADTSVGSVGSVLFGLDSVANYHNENFAPYALAGNSGSTFIPWTPSVGSHTVKATPYSAASDTGVAGSAMAVSFAVVDSAVNIPVDPPPAPVPVPPPAGSGSAAISVAITNPVNGAIQAAPGFYVIRSNAADTAGSISSVAFYANGNFLGMTDAAPFSFAWKNASAGSYHLTAVATDNNGLTNTSAAVSVTISGAPAGQTFFVDPNGSDSNAGLSSSAPLRTISAAANKAQAGDTVLIDPGTYREAVTVPHSGTSAAPITFKAVQAGTVFIDGADPIGGWSASGSSNPIFTTAWNHDFFWSGTTRYHNGFSTDGTSTTTGYAEQFLYNGQPLTQVLSASSLTAGTFSINYSARTVSVWLPGGATPTSGNMLASTRNHLFTPASASVQYIRVDGLVMQHAANFAQAQAVQTATGWRILNSTVQWVNTGGIGTKGSDVLIDNVHALHNGQIGIGGSGVNVLFVNDETAFNNYKQFSAFGEAGGGKYAQGDGLYFDGYNAHDNIGPGLWLDYKNTNYVVMNSYIHDNKPRVASYEGVGLLIEVSDGPGRVDSNTIYNNTGAGLDICESMNVTVLHNTFANGYLELRDMTNRAPYHIQNERIINNYFKNADISTSLGTWSTTSGATKQIYINGDTFDNKGGQLFWWANGSYSTPASAYSKLGFELNGKLAAVTFTPLA